MGIPDREPGLHDTRLTGTSTGQVQVGRYVLDVPSPGGTTLSLAPRRARTEPPTELTAALAQPTADAPAERGLVDRANQLLDSAEAVTGKVQDATDTVQALLSGRLPDPELISEDLADWLELMQRLAGSGRFAEVIKLGRPVCRLLALTLRWAALVETLRLVFHAATALADTPTIAWTQHELGTLHGSVGNVDRARELLDQARTAREAIGDREGLRATDHNLKVLSGRIAISTSTAALVGVGIAVVIVAVLVFTETVGGGSSRGSVAASTSATRSATTTATVDSSTTSHSSGVRTDSSQTEANPPVAVPRPRTITFTATTIGTSQPAQLNLVNDGPGPLAVTSAQISEAPQFTIATDACSGHTVPARTFCTVTIEFTPASTGAATATLTFTDDADPATQPVELSGTGQPQTTAGSDTTTPTSPSSGTTTQAPPA
jgi:hypothetical protein